jgi:type 1 glutamine amidotransferase
MKLHCSLRAGLRVMPVAAAFFFLAGGACTRSVPHVVFVSGEPEYKSERTLPTIAAELESRHGMKCSMLVWDSDANFPGLELLEQADVAVFYLRFLKVPEEQLNQFKAYFDSGKPVVALRTTTHAFLEWKEFAPTVLGTPWWQFHYGHESSSDVRIIPEAAGHPILRGIEPEFHSRSWLYYVHPLSEGTEPLLVGKSVGPSPREERVENPVAWTYRHKGGRVFYTSLGHPDDFEVPSFRRLVINGIFWALDKPVPE